MKNYFRQAFNIAEWVVTAIFVFIFTPDLVSRLHQRFKEFWSGFTRIAHPDNVPHLLGDKNSRQVLVRSGLTNLVTYAGLILFYEGGVRRLLRVAVPAVEGSYVEISLDLVVRISLATRFFVRNRMLDAAIVQAARLDYPVNIKPCSHDTVTRLQSSLASTMYHVGNSTFAAGLGIIAPISKIPVRSMLYGRAFLEAGITRDMCTDDRNKILNYNNLYGFGLGLCFLMLTSLASIQIRDTFSLKNTFIDDAISAYLYHHFLMLMLTNDIPLVGKPESKEDLGVDMAYLGRVGTRTILQHLLNNYITPIATKVMQIKGEGFDWNKAEKLFNHPAMRLVTTYLFDADWQHREDFLDQPTTHLLFILYRKRLKNILADLKIWRKSIQFYNPIVDLLPASVVPAYKVELVHYVSSVEFKNKIEEIRRFLAWVKGRYTQPKVKIIEISEQDSQQLNVNADLNYPYAQPAPSRGLAKRTMPKFYNEGMDAFKTRLRNQVEAEQGGDDVVPSKPALFYPSVFDDDSLLESQDLVPSKPAIVSDQVFGAMHRAKEGQSANVYDDIFIKIDELEKQEQEAARKIQQERHQAAHANDGEDDEIPAWAKMNHAPLGCQLSAAAAAAASPEERKQMIPISAFLYLNPASSTCSSSGASGEPTLLPLADEMHATIAPANETLPVVEMKRVQAASKSNSPVAAPVLFRAVEPASLDTAPGSTASTVSSEFENVLNVGAVLVAIANLPSWSRQVAFLHQDAPNGVQNIRWMTRNTVSLDNVYKAIKNHLSAGKSRSEMTQAFYNLISECYLARHDVFTCRNLLVIFAKKYLTPQELASLPLMPSEPVKSSRHARS